MGKQANRRKPWPGTMLATFIVNGVLVALLLAVAIDLMVEYITRTNDPNDTDAFISFSLYGAILLFILAIVLAGMTAVLLSRSPLGRIVYTIVILIGVTSSFTVVGWYAAGPDIALIATVVLIWLPRSKPFFTDLPGVSYYPGVGPSGTLR